MRERSAGRDRDWPDNFPDEDEFGLGGDDALEEEPRWQRPNGIFVIAPIHGAAGDAIAKIQRRYDPKLAASSPPHVTLIGSSGAGPIAPGTSEAELRAALEPITRTAPPIELHFGPPTRFMQTNIVSLPLAAHGPVRELFERIRASGLRFGRARFAFTPHATLSYFPTLERPRERELLSLRVGEPAVLDMLQLSLTDDPQPPRPLFELPLLGRR